MKTRGAVVVSAILTAMLIGSGGAVAGPPNAPSDLLVSGAFSSAGGEASVLLSWTHNSDNDAGFLIQASEDGGHTWISVAYTPNDYITLHKTNFMSTLGYYPGLTPGTHRIFRVAATHPTGGTSDFSKEVEMDMPLAATCSSPYELQPVQDFGGHVGFPVDLTVMVNRPFSCREGYQYCLQDGPTGMTIDFSGGLVTWVPTAVYGWGGWVPVTLGFGTGDNLHHCISTVATSSFWIKVDDNTLTLPLFRDYRSEATTIPVQGRAYQNFASYALYSSPLCSTYAGDNCPNSIISLPSTTPVPTTGLLANWDDTSLPDGSRRLVSFIVQAPTFENSAIYDPIILDRTAWNTSWPKRLPLGSIRGALAVDLNGDGIDEIIGGARGPAGGPFDWNLDGTLRWQAPNPNSVTSSDPAAGDITGDGNYEVVTTTLNALRVLNGTTGALLASVLASSIGSNYQFQAGASLADISGDGVLDILVNINGSSGSPLPAAKTLAYRWNGTGLVAVTGWPQTLTSSYASSPPSTADLDGNGSLEVVVDNDTKLYAWNSNGTAFGSFPVNLPLRPTASSVNGGSNPFGFSQPAIADIDGNGTLDIVVGQNVFTSTGTYFRCLKSGSSCTAITGSVGLSPAIGQFDLTTATPEILLGGSVFSGTTGLLIRTLGAGAAYEGPAALVDGGLDGQGNPQTYAVMGTMLGSQFTHNISAFDGAGNIEEGYPKALYGGTGSGSAPQVGDFDGDGNEDALVEITDSTYGAVVALYKTPNDTPFNASNNPWPMHGHDAQRTGRFSCKQQRQSCTSNSQCCSNSCSTTCR